MNEALQRLHTTGATIISLTCDGPASHFAMMRALGADLTFDSMQAFYRMHVLLRGLLYSETRAQYVCRSAHVNGCRGQCHQLGLPCSTPYSRPITSRGPLQEKWRFSKDMGVGHAGLVKLCRFDGQIQWDLDDSWPQVTVRDRLYHD